jgi:hypothetical protein
MQRQTRAEPYQLSTASHLTLVSTEFVGQMASFSRSSALSAVVIAVLLAALPGAIRRIIQPGDPYSFTHDFFADLLARLSGPGRMRFILQPTVAIVLGARDERFGAHCDHAMDCRFYQSYSCSTPDYDSSETMKRSARTKGDSTSRPPRHAK